MDTVLIRKLLKSFKCFKGVYPLDLIPTIKKKPIAIIVNTHPSDKPGEHWVTIIISRNGIGEYFDSFGLPPLHAEFVKYLDKNCEKGWRFNPIPLQNQNSTTCGHYCVLYVIFRCLGYSYDDFIGKFTKNTIENDSKVIDIFGYYPFSI
jgi:hypothetical protein